MWPDSYPAPGDTTVGNVDAMNTTTSPGAASGELGLGGGTLSLVLYRGLSEPGRYLDRRNFKMIRLMLPLAAQSEIDNFWQRERLPDRFVAPRTALGGRTAALAFLGYVLADERAVRHLLADQQSSG
jgi:hypothetical protein